MVEILIAIAKVRKPSYTKPADIRRIQEARKSGDWSNVFKSTLYRKHGGEYCELLSLIPWHELPIGSTTPTMVAHTKCDACGHHFMSNQLNPVALPRLDGNVCDRCLPKVQKQGRQEIQRL